MKKMNKHLAVAVGVVMLGGILQAKVLNVDIQPAGAGSTYAVNYSGQGAANDPGNNLWNVAGPDAPAGGSDESGGWVAGLYSKSGLLYSDGTASGMSISWTDGVIVAISDAHGGYGDLATDATGLMRDYLQMDASTWGRSVFLEGLTPGQEYHLYLYAAGPWNRDTKFAVRCDKDTNKNWGSEQWIGEATTDASTTTDPHTLTEGVDYVKFDFTTDPEMDTIWIEYQGDGDGDDMAPFNGLQLVVGPETTGTVSSATFRLFFVK